MVIQKEKAWGGTGSNKGQRKAENKKVYTKLWKRTGRSGAECVGQLSDGDDNKMHARETNRGEKRGKLGEHVPRRVTESGNVGLPGLFATYAIAICGPGDSRRCVQLRFLRHSSRGILGAW